MCVYGLPGVRFLSPIVVHIFKFSIPSSLCVNCGRTLLDVSVKIMLRLLSAGRRQQVNCSRALFVCLRGAGFLHLTRGPQSATILPLLVLRNTCTSIQVFHAWCVRGGVLVSSREHAPIGDEI